MGSNIFFKPEVIDYLNQLVSTLIFKEYFSYKENAISYVADIIEDITVFIEVKKQHKTPVELESYGKYYIKIRKSRRTNWYIFFDKKEKHYFIQYITNNHTAKASFIDRLK